MNRFEKYLKAALQWIRLNQERFWAIAGISVITLVVATFMIRHRAQMNGEAWTQLGIVQGHAFQGQWNEASKNLEDWEKRFQGTSAASYAKFMKADLLARATDYAGASAIYAELALSASPKPLRPLALAAHASTEEAAGQAAQSIVVIQTFLDQYPDHFMAGPLVLSQARLTEKSGNTAQAAALYDRFQLLYPQNPWTDIVQSRKALVTPPSR